MRVRALLPVAAAAALPLAAASPAWADVPHTVAPGESLWSVAETDGLSVAQLATANGLPSTSHLVAGTTLMIPPEQRAGGNGGNRGAVTSGSGGHGETNVTALVQANIGSIQANIGSNSQYNTADGSAVEAIGASGGNARGGNGGTARGGDGGNGGTARGGNGGTVATLVHANVGSSDASNTTNGWTAKGNGDTGNPSSGGAAGVGLRTRALPSRWKRLGKLAMPGTLARSWLVFLERLAEGATYYSLSDLPTVVGAQGGSTAGSTPPIDPALTRNAQ